jgi:hypothetical protein
LLFLAWELLQGEEENEKKAKQFFFEKKNQKTSALWHAPVEMLGSIIRSLAFF